MMGAEVFVREVARLVEGPIASNRPMSPTPELETIEALSAVRAPVRIVQPVLLDPSTVDARPRDRRPEVDPASVIPKFRYRPQTLDRPLAEWRSLAVRLSSRLRSARPSNRIDLAAVTDAIVKNRVVRRLPFRNLVGWGRELIVIVDRSDRLMPFWSDQDDVVRRLQSVLGRHAVREIVIRRDPDDGWVDEILETASASARVLLLGDLGGYVTSRVATAWRSFGQRLWDEGFECHAIVPCPAERIDPECRRLWRAAAWEADSRSMQANASSRDRGFDLLAVAISIAVRVEPQLLRAMRDRLAGRSDVIVDIATEYAVWNSSSMKGHMSAAATPDRDYALSARRRFAAWDVELQYEIVDVLRRFRRHGPDEVFHEEVLSAVACGIEGFTKVEIAAAENYFKSLAEAVGRDGPRSSAERSIVAYFSEVEARLPEAAVERDDDVGDALRYLSVVVGSGKSRSRPFAAAGPRTAAAMLTTDREPTMIALWLVGRQLHLRTSEAGSPMLGPATVGTNLAFLRLRRPTVMVRPLGTARGEQVSWDPTKEATLTWPDADEVIVQSDLESLTFAAREKPAWAAAYGRDRFGSWADIIVNGVRQRMRLIPPGSYVQGSPENEFGRFDSEGPRRRVTFTKGFWLGETPVTQAFWEACGEKNPSRFAAADRPMEKISWNECRAMIERLNRRIPGLDMSLPSEAQWEYACRGGTLTITYAGDVKIDREGRAPDLDRIAWYDGNSDVEDRSSKNDDILPWTALRRRAKGRGTQPVAQLLPNRWGLYDMLGNVFEWCDDHWSWGDPYPEGDVVDPLPVTRGADRVCRGASWSSEARDVRAAFRGVWDGPDNRGDFLGFRLARKQND